MSGLLALAGGLCWAELATVFPRQGGTYIFIKDGLGDAPAFVYIIIRYESNLTFAISADCRVFLLNPCAGAVQALAASKYLLGTVCLYVLCMVVGIY